MDCKNRDGSLYATDNGQDNLLKKLYGSVGGRCALKILTKPVISELAGMFLDSKFSTFLINPFIKANNLDMSEYVSGVQYKSYNDFFTREIKSECRPIDNHSQIFISPCDGRISIYDINEDSSFLIKDTLYNVETITKSKKASNIYKNGKFVIIRLCVDNYHRYCYLDNGHKTKNKAIAGVLHTVNPIANDYFEIYKENSRECSVLYTENFGRVMQIEVGALMVGRIKNYDEEGSIKKGMPKGKFEFGGSTICLLVEKDKVIFDEDIIVNTNNGYETAIKMGEQIGIKA